MLLNPFRFGSIFTPKWDPARLSTNATLDATGKIITIPQPGGGADGGTELALPYLITGEKAYWEIKVLSTPALGSSRPGIGCAGGNIGYISGTPFTLDALPSSCAGSSSPVAYFAYRYYDGGAPNYSSSIVTTVLNSSVATAFAVNNIIGYAIDASSSTSVVHKIYLNNSLIAQFTVTNNTAGQPVFSDSSGRIHPMVMVDGAAPSSSVLQAFFLSTEWTYSPPAGHTQLQHSL